MPDTIDEFREGRARPTNYIQICRNLADSYPSVFHGVQKDAIQNAMDARKGRTAVHVEFNLFKIQNGTLFTITDSNTVGLSGPVLIFMRQGKTFRKIIIGLVLNLSPLPKKAPMPLEPVDKVNSFF